MATGETEENNVVLGPVARGGFPARSLTSRLPDSSSGEWLLAYQAEQTKYLRAMFASVRNAFQRNLALSSDGAVSIDVEKRQRSEPILNKEFIIKHCYVENPTDLYVCNISSCGLSESMPEEFLDFNCVEEVIANDNKLPFEIFAFFPSLQELELSINHIKDISYQQSQFTNLQVLNLSYNALTDSAILLLGLLPNLKEVHLTGNDIVALPIEMSRALIETKEDGSSAVQMRYTCLEKLWLDDNKLTDLSTFAILAGLRRLKMLNLDNNEIYSIPQLKLLGADNLQQKSSTLTATNSQEPLVKHQSSVQSLGANSSSSVVDADELNALALRGTLKPSQVSVSQAQFNLAPFPCLETLSIANNMIMTAEGLVAINVWPSLDTVKIHGNPITRLNKGLPPLLKSELVDPFGIKIVRQVTDQSCKPKVAGKTANFVKVSEQPPPVIPKQPLLAIEQSPSLSEDTASYYDSSTTIVPPYMRTYPHTPTDSVVLSNGSRQERRPSTVGTSGRTDVLLQAVVPLEQKPKKRLPLAIAYKADPTSSGNVVVTQSLDSDDVLEDSGVFITQVKDDGAPSPKPCSHHESDSPDVSVEEEFKRNLSRIRNKWKNVPDKFKGFEALLESDSEGEDDTSPSDIAQCTRALKHALDHPLLLTDCSKPNPSGKQYLRRKACAWFLEIAFVRESKSVTPQTKALPHKVKEIQQVLHSIKGNCNTLEANLSDVLESKPSKRPLGNTKKLKKESKDLLKEIQLKYANVRRNSLIPTRELASILK